MIATYLDVSKLIKCISDRLLVEIYMRSLITLYTVVFKPIMFSVNSSCMASMHYNKRLYNFEFLSSTLFSGPCLANKLYIDECDCTCNLQCSWPRWCSNVELSWLWWRLKGTRILFQFLFLIEKSILYAKIAVSQKIFFQNSLLNIILVFIFIVAIIYKYSITYVSYSSHSAH